MNCRRLSPARSAASLAIILTDLESVPSRKNFNIVIFVHVFVSGINDMMRRDVETLGHRFSVHCRTSGKSFRMFVSCKVPRLKS